MLERVDTGPDLFGFPIAIGRLSSKHDLGTAIERAIAPFGFTGYVIGAVPPPANPEPTPFTFDNVDPRFWEIYLAEGMATRDPAIRAATLICGPVTFQQIREGRAGFIPMPQEIEVLDLTARFGNTHGILIPVFRAQGYRGVVAFVGAGPEPDERSRIALQFIAQHAHDRARALFSRVPQNAAITLTPREVEILTLAQRGFSDDEIGQAAGITVRTVRFHFDNLRRRLNARNRSEAIATAVHLHLLPT